MYKKVFYLYAKISECNELLKYQCFTASARDCSTRARGSQNEVLKATSAFCGRKTSPSRIGFLRDFCLTVTHFSNHRQIY